jgi:hypothetical protein
MAFRRFVLEPAVDVAADLRHPLLGWTVRRLLDHLNTAVNYVALTGVPGTGKTAAAERLAACGSVRLILDPCLRTPASEAINAWEPTEDSTGLLGAEAARLAERVRVLDAETWPAGMPRAVSDFWLGQSRAYVRRVPTPAAERSWETLYQQSAQRVVEPKLLVLIDTAPSPDAAREELRTHLRQCVQDWKQGPTLVLDATPPATVLTELAAAVQAMQ